MSYSKLATEMIPSPNKTSPRNHKIDTITIHCMAGNATAHDLGDWFKKKSTEASSNYGVDSNGRIACYVDENDRSWCSSSSANDHRAITIEVGNDGKADTGWHVTDKALAALIDLLVDVCQRNGIKQLLWKNDKSLIGKVDQQNMTLHRWFANKDCPGEYLISKHPYIVGEVNKRLASSAQPSTTPSDSKPSYPDVANAQPFPADVVSRLPIKVKVNNSCVCMWSQPNNTGAFMGYCKAGEYVIEEISSAGAMPYLVWGRLPTMEWIYLGCLKDVEYIGEYRNNYFDVPFFLQVKVNNYNIYSEPKATSQTRGFTGVGTFTIVEVKDGFGKLKSGAGWVMLPDKENCSAKCIKG